MDDSAMDELAMDDLAMDDLATEEMRRGLYTTLRFWKACPSACCQRHRRCAGDLRCYPLFWPLVSETTKAWWIIGLAARRDRDLYRKRRSRRRWRDTRRL
jgi:hypothetical protein